MRVNGQFRVNVADRRLVRWWLTIGLRSLRRGTWTSEPISCACALPAHDMKAVRLHKPGDLRIEEVDEQALGPADVRIEVAYTGICGSDLHEYVDGPIAARAEDWNHEVPEEFRSAYLPKFLGHETVGTVVETGEEVADVAEGDRVALCLIDGCGECRECTRGDYHLCSAVDKAALRTPGFAEELVAPASATFEVPEAVSLQEAAPVEPLSVSVHGVRRGGLAMGDTALVVGAGAIGLGVVQAAQAAGSSRVVVSEPREARRRAAETAGADLVFDPVETDVRERVREELDGGADVAFEAAGVESSLTDAVRATKYGGTTVVMSYFEESVNVHPNDLMETERSLVGALAYEAGPRAPHGEFPTVLGMIADGRLDPGLLVTDVIDLEDVQKGFERLLDPGSEHVKILVEP